MLRLTATGSPLAALRQRLSNKAALLSPLAAPTLAAVRANFAAGGRPAPWKPLAESTLSSRGAGAAPLVETGRLRDSLRAQVRGDRLVVSTSVPYAAVQQFGSRRVPARPFLVLPEGEIQRLAGLLAQQLGDRS